MLKCLTDEQIEELKKDYPNFSNEQLAMKYGVRKTWIDAFGQNNKIKKIKRQHTPIEIGDKFGKLEVKEKTGVKSKNNYVYLCLCECGSNYRVRASLLRARRTLECGKCHRLKNLETNASTRFNKGCGSMGGTFWSKVRSHAHERGIEFLVQKEDAYALYEKQGGRCALSGVEIKFSESYTDSSKGTASLDRIDNSKCYTLDNIQWVHKEINFMKNKMTDERFIELCKEVAKYQEFK